MKLLDFMDDFVWGPFNNAFRLFGIPARLLKPSKGGRFGPTIQIRLRRIDKGGNTPFVTTIQHLERYGVNTFDHGYNSQWFWFSVRKTQAKYARWLYNGGNFRTPKRAWKR